MPEGNASLSGIFFALSRKLSVKKVVCLKRAFCFFLAFVLLFLTASCGKTSPEESATRREEVQPQAMYTARPSRWSKKEAVFVTLSPTGEPKSIRVTDRISTDRPQVRVDDVSFLRNIRNLKGTEEPVTDGVNLTWHMTTQELFYSGETDKLPPVLLSIAYGLDGQPVEPDKLRGRQGTVQMRVRARNTLQTGDLCTPFILLGGTILPQDALDVRVENGGMLGDGNRDAVFSLLLPGMAQSLGLTDAKLLPDAFTVTFRTQRFTPCEWYFVLLPLSTLQMEDALRSVFGAADLPQFDASPVLSALRSFDGEQIRGMLAQLPQSASLFRTADDAMQAYEAEQPLLDVLQTYLTQENAALLQQTIDSLSGTTLQEYAALLQNPAFVSLLADMSTVSAAFSGLIPVLTSFIADLRTPQVRAAISALPDTMQKLRTLTDALEKNRQFLQTLTDFSASGTLTQFGTLLESVQSMLDSGTIETLQSLAGRTDRLREKLNALLEEGKKYGIFTVAPQDAETSVYFVYKTE